MWKGDATPRIPLALSSVIGVGKSVCRVHLKNDPLLKHITADSLPAQPYYQLSLFVLFFFVINPWLDPISKTSSLFSHLLLHLIDSWICWWLTEITCFFFRLCGLDELILHEGLCGHCAGHCLTALSFWTYSIFLTLSLGDAKVTIAVPVRVRWCSTSLFLSLLPPPLLNPTQTPPQQKSRKQNCKAVPNQLTRLTDCKIGW